MALKKQGKKPQWLQPPQQQRSNASLQRILDAAERLMEEKSYSEITVAAITRQARSSVSVFYSRFPDKLALLHHVDERFAQDAEAVIVRRFRIEEWRGRSLAEASAAAIDFICRSHLQKRGMLKSVILEVRLHPNQRFQQTGKRLLRVVDKIAVFLASWRSEIPHPDPEQAVRLALMMVISFLRDYVVFAKTTMFQDLLGMAPEALPAALTDFFLAMVGNPPAESSSPPGCGRR